jgi:hypothetical protein
VTAAVHGRWRRWAAVNGVRVTDQRGVGVVDVVIACGILLVVGGMVAPELHRLQGHARVVAAARFMSGRLHAARFEAIRRNRVVAVDIASAEAGAAFTLVADGNGNGVLRRDIDTGIDMPLGPAERLDHHFAGVSFRVRDATPDVEGDGVIAAGSDPARFGPSDLVSCHPMGGCTSGTLYIAAAAGPQAAVRLLGSTGRIRAMWFDASAGRWRED